MLEKRGCDTGGALRYWEKDKVSNAGKGEQREATIGEERGRGSGWRSRGS